MQTINLKDVERGKKTTAANKSQQSFNKDKGWFFENIKNFW